MPNRNPDDWDRLDTVNLCLFFGVGVLVFFTVALICLMTSHTVIGIVCYIAMFVCLVLFNLLNPFKETK